MCYVSKLQAPSHTGRAEVCTSVHLNFPVAAVTEGVVVEICTSPVWNPHSTYIATTQMPVTRTACFIAYSSCSFRARRAERAEQPEQVQKAAVGLALGRSTFSSSHIGIDDIVGNDRDDGIACYVGTAVGFKSRPGPTIRLGVQGCPCVSDGARWNRANRGERELVLTTLWRVGCGVWGFHGSVIPRPSDKDDYWK